MGRYHQSNLAKKLTQESSVSLSLPRTSHLEDMTGPEQQSVSWIELESKAIEMLAEDLLTDTEIAKRLGVHRLTIARWKREPSFMDQVKAQAVELGEICRRYAITRQARRLSEMDRRYHKMIQVINERANDPDMQRVPGGKTGLLVRKIKSVGAGEDSQIVEEFEVDTGLLKEIRELEKQVAQEIGQYEHKDPSLTINVHNLTVEQRTERLHQILGSLRQRAGIAGDNGPAGPPGYLEAVPDNSTGTGLPLHG